MEVLFILDLIGTAVFAYSGALAARGHGYHILGVLYIALLTAVGGGTLRFLLLQTPGLFWFESSAYAWVVVSAVALSYFLKLRTNSALFYLLDSFSLAVFTAIGFSAPLNQGFALHVAFGMGVLSGIGGGLIRDAITSQPPQALSDPVYPFMIFAGSAGCLLATSAGLPVWSLSVAMVLVVALISIMMRDRLPAVVAKPPGASGAAVLSFEVPGAARVEQRSDQKQSVPRTIAKAATVLIMTFAIGLYFVEPLSNTAVANNQPVLSLSSADKLFDERISLARWQLENNDLAGVNQSIVDAGLLDPHHQLIAPLKKERDLLADYLQHIALAEAAYEADNLKAMRQSLALAANYDRHGNKFTYLQSALNTRLSQIEVERRHQALAESSVNLHVSNAKQYLLTGNSIAAERELAMAEAYGLVDGEIADLRAKLVRQANQSKPEINSVRETLSKQDINYAEVQFGKLQKAIELRNLPALKVLTSENNDKYDLFSKLFDRYVQFDVQLTQLVSTKQNVTARLELERMRLPNGNYTYPSSKYGVIALNLKLTDQGWTKIQW